MDTMGRYMAGLVCMNITRKLIIVLSYLRTLQVGIFLLCAFEVTPDALFGADWFKLLNFSIFAFTNGYYSSLCSIQAPEVVKNRSLSGGAEMHIGAFIGVSKCLGILIGASLALPMKEIIKMTPAAAAS